MSEYELQNKILLNLKKTWKTAQIKSEVSYLSGVKDIEIKHKNLKYSIEVKLKPNLELISQLVKQNLESHFLIAITLKPSKKETILKWKKIAKKNYINLIFSDEQGNVKINNRLIKNKNYDDYFVKALSYV